MTLQNIIPYFSPNGLRPSTLPLSQGGFPQSWIFTNERGVNILFIRKLYARAGLEPAISDLLFTGPSVLCTLLVFLNCGIHQVALVMTGMYFIICCIRYHLHHTKKTSIQNTPVHYDVSNTIQGQSAVIHSLRFPIANDRDATFKISIHHRN